MDFKLVLPSIYINFDIHIKFEVNQTQIGHSIPKKLQKLTKVAISQNPILPKCHSPKSLLLLHFSMNLSETFRIDVNMDFEPKIEPKIQGLTWAMLYLWTQNYSQIIGTCPGHHGQLISQNFVLTKIRAEPPPPPPPP